MTLRIAICGCGHRSRSVWQRHVGTLPGVDLVGVHDPDPASFEPAIAIGRITRAQCFLKLDEMLDRTAPDALIVCSINEAHAASVASGLDAGCNVLVEKPFTTNLADAVQLTRLAQRKGLVLAVVQNWRTKSVGQALRAAVQAEVIGQVSHIFFRYLRDRETPNLAEYLFSERDPLLFAMAIHHFDLFRFTLGEEIVKVSGHSFRPRWSRYRHASGMQLWMETESGVFISYAATFSSRNGHLPLESLQVEGEGGTLTNESQFSEPPLWLSRRGEPSMIDLTAEIRDRGVAEQYDLADFGILRNFLEAISEGTQLVTSAQDNLGTLAVIEAARLATTEQRSLNPRLLLADLQEERHA